MKLRDFRWLADENIPEGLLDFLRQNLVNVSSIRALNLKGITDQEVLALAQEKAAIVLT